MQRVRSTAAASLHLTSNASLQHIEGLTFDSARPHTFCLICGAVFQQPLDRVQQPTQLQELTATLERRSWSLKHAKTHSARLHALLRRSGMWAFPEAAEKLATYGIYAIGAAVLNSEVRAALQGSKSLPINDAEGGQ